MPDLDGLIKLNDARIKSATSQADIANKMADVAKKIAELGKIREEVIKMRLENIAKALDIKWDKQAHRNLLRVRKQAMQRDRRLTKEKERLEKHCGRLSNLLRGAGSWTVIRNAWISFNYAWGASSIAAVTAAGSIDVSDVAYLETSWKHPKGLPIEPLPAEERFLGALWDWARQRTVFPRTGSAAWTALANVLQSLSDSAQTEAEKMATEIEAVHKEAIELSKLDWDRLKE